MMNTRQQGFTIVEVVVAMVMLAVILTLMGGITFSAARQSLINGTAAQRQAASLELVNRYTALPFASLQAFSDTVDYNGNRFERTVQVTVRPDSAVIIIATKPMRAGVPATSVRLVRSRNAAAQNSLCTPSC
jgi:prepilin-type N-terminal cleavage/methylation domain-containing protein